MCSVMSSIGCAGTLGGSAMLDCCVCTLGGGAISLPTLGGSMGLSVGHGGCCGTAALLLSTIFGVRMSCRWHNLGRYSSGKCFDEPSNSSCDAIRWRDRRVGQIVVLEPHCS